MRKTQFASTFALIFISSSIFTFGQAQSEMPTLCSWLSDLIGRTQIRQSLIDKNSTEKPAAFQFVIPHDDKKGNTYSVDFGALIPIVDGTYWTIAPTLEFHRQTALAKKQNNIQFGLSIIRQFGKTVEKGDNDNKGDFYGLRVQGGLTYKNDWIIGGESLVAKTNLIPIWRNIGVGVRNDHFDFCSFRWQPVVGLQYESASNVMKSGQAGTAARIYAGIDLTLWPLAQLLQKRLVFIVQEKDWYNISRSGGFKDLCLENQNYFSVSLTFYIDAGQHVGIGGEYFYGENPELGLLKQQATTLSLKIRV